MNANRYIHNPSYDPPPDRGNAQGSDMLNAAENDGWGSASQQPAQQSWSGLPAQSQAHSAAGKGAGRATGRGGALQWRAQTTLLPPYIQKIHARAQTTQLEDTRDRRTASPFNGIHPHTAWISRDMEVSRANSQEQLSRPNDGIYGYMFVSKVTTTSRVTFTLCLEHMHSVVCPRLTHQPRMQTLFTPRSKKCSNTACSAACGSPHCTR